MRLRNNHRREALVKAASEVFLSMGYERATVDEIVRRAGGSKSSVYMEFGGKIGIFKAAVQALCSQVTAPVAAIDYSGLDLEAGLKKFGETLLRYVTKKRVVAFDRLILSEATRCPEIGLVWYLNGPEKSREACANLLASYVHESDALSIPVHQLAMRFHDMLVWDVQHRALAAMTISSSMIRQTVDEAVRVLLNGLRSNTR